MNISPIALEFSIKGKSQIRKWKGKDGNRRWITHPETTSEIVTYNIKR
jgi:hypothetical protein